MKRLHVSLAVADLGASVRFYSGLFGAPPTVEKGDYAKWLLDDPRVNFSLTARGRSPGVSHLGIQAETPGELDEVYARFRAAEGPFVEQGAATCCYAKSEKAWLTDPQGIAWEAFHTTGASAEFGADDMPAPAARTCCTPAADGQDKGCCG